MVSVISSTWMLVGGPGGPDECRSQAGRKRYIERNREEGRCGEGDVNREKSERWEVLAPAAMAAKSVQCEPFGRRSL